MSLRTPSSRRELLGLLALALLAMVSLAAPARAQCSAIPDPNWASEIDPAASPFVVRPIASDVSRWVKFTILRCDPTRVYFQDSVDLPFHFEFGTTYLRPLLGLSRAAFDQATLRLAGQQAVLGAVLFSPREIGVTEFGVQFVGADPYPRELVRDLFNAVRASLQNIPNARGYYMPVFEQQASAQADAAWFAQEGLPLSTPDRWSPGNRVYAEGWAIGTLMFFPASEVPAAYAQGRLTANDILLTDAVPAELPFLAGIASLSPGTPNSHVAILAQTYQVPYAFLADARDADHARTLVGRLVIQRAYTTRGITSRLIDAEHLSPTQRAEILALKAPTPLNYAPMQPAGTLYRDTDELVASDIRFVGGKAANYGTLRRSITANTRPALAFTFDLWNAYLDQVVSSGRTLRDEIATRLAPHAWPPNPAALEADLTAIRQLFTNTAATQFSPALQTQVLAALQDPRFGFSPQFKLRFRSSTNVEDSSSYTGAGLYDSFSGCLADDLDADTIGPSNCDPAEPNERGVFRAIRRVFASFYNTNAFAQRLRLGVREREVGMALLVHHSFPDAYELANGVVVLERTRFTTSLTINTQRGAESVTNPTPGIIAEEVALDVPGFPRLIRSSNRVLLGDTVMDFPGDYTALGTLLNAAANRYTVESGQTEFFLDFEFKKTLDPMGNPPATLDIKQIRPLPRPSNTPSITPFLINESGPWCVYHGERTNPFASLRFKRSMALASRSMWLTPPNLAAGLHESFAFDADAGCASPVRSGGVLASLPGASHAMAQGLFGLESQHRWQAPNLPNPRTLTLHTLAPPALVPPSASPILTPSDLGHGTSGGHTVLDLSVEYAQPVITIDENGEITRLASEQLSIIACDQFTPTEHAGGSYQTPDGVIFDIEASLGSSPRGVAAGFTAPIMPDIRAVITGLTSTPLVLRVPWASSATPAHHNFGATFVFEPREEPTLTSLQRRQLRARNIDLIVLTVGFQDATVRYLADACPTCPADLDDGTGLGIPDAGVTIDDLLYFLGVYQQGAIDADLDDGTGLGTPDAGVTIDDLLYFLLRYESGC